MSPAKPSGITCSESTFLAAVCALLALAILYCLNYLKTRSRKEFLSNRAVKQVEQTLAHLGALRQILARISLRLRGRSNSACDAQFDFDPIPLLLLNQPEFGQFMRHLREKLGWSRNELADLSGLAASTIHNLEIRTTLSLPDRVRHRIVIALMGQCRYAPRCNKAEE